MFDQLGSLIVRRRRVVLAGWAVLFVLGVAAAGGVFSDVTSDMQASRRFDSQRTATRLWALHPDGGAVYAIVDRVDTAAPAVREAVTAAGDDIASLPGVASVHDGYRTPDAGLLAADGTAAIVAVDFRADVPGDEHDDAVHRAAARLRQIDVGRVVVGGDLLQDDEFSTGAERDLQRGEAVALPIAFVAMIVVFGGALAAFLPILIALCAIAGAFLVLLVATAFGDVSQYAINVATMFGLGLGIDYGLLTVSRFREHRARGLDTEAAAIATVGTAGTTVVFSALTVAVALCGLFVFDVPALHSLAAGGIGVVLFAMLAAVTLLPALLPSLGRRIRPGRAASSDHGYFRTLSGLVQRRAVPVVVVVAGVLTFAAAPFLHARFEQPDARSLPKGAPSRQLFDRYHAHFGVTQPDAVTVLADVPRTDARSARWVASLRLRSDVTSVTVDDAFPESVTVVDLVPTGTAQGAAAQRLVADLRSHPPSFAVGVTGDAAELVDFKKAVHDRLPAAVLLIAAASLVLLFTMTGSVVVAAKALVMNLLSLGATFGAMVWIFQEGHLAGALGFDATGALDAVVPLVVFIFAFGLSMDYEVFLLARIKEAHDETGDNDLAVAVGLQRTGRIITSAALLIIVVFAGFAAGELLIIKQLGVGLAIAVLVDATIVRSLLVPATMRLLGELNWWAPTPLRRLHRRIGLHEPADDPIPEPLPVA